MAGRSLSSDASAVLMAGAVFCIRPGKGGTMIRCKLCDDADEAGCPVHGFQHYRPLWPMYRVEQMKAHYPYGSCGPNGETLLRENGYLYPLSYLLRVAQEGGPLFFQGDAEWLAWVTA